MLWDAASSSKPTRHTNRGFNRGVFTGLLFEGSTRRNPETGRVDMVRRRNKGPVPYNYAFFHLIFAMAAMYTAMLMTGWGQGQSQGQVRSLPRKREHPPTPGKSFQLSGCRP